MERNLVVSLSEEAEPWLRRVREWLKEQGVAAYLVGGFVRDRLLHRDTRDIDLAVAAPSLPLAEKLAPALGGKYFPLDRENGVARLVLPGGEWHLDLATIQGDIERDLARRDFTIDAIAISLEEDRLIDPFGGQADLSRGLVRVVAEGAFKVDPARLLRAVRLAAELGFSLEPETRALMKQYAPLIAGVAGERVREELMRLLSLPSTAPYLRWLNELGLLGTIFPELERGRGVEQPKEHHWDVLDHSIETVAAAESLLKQGGLPGAAEHLAAVIAGFPRLALFKLGCLLHDIAKPQTRGRDEKGRLRFLGHGRLGAEMAVGIMRRLRFSSREAELVRLMVEHHLRPTQMGQGGLPTPRAIYRFFRDSGEAAPEVLYLSLADHLAARGPDLVAEDYEEHTRLVSYVLEEHHRQQPSPHPPRLITGDDIMAAFGLSPGPEIGRLLEAVREAHAAGEIATREQALALAGKELGEKP